MLNFANLHLCGRNNEKAALQDAYKRSKDSSFQVVWIKGLSGTGKSTLVDNVFGQDESTKNLFCWGKFEQQRSVVPHYVLANLLSRLWCIIEQDYPDMQHCSDDLKVLSNLVPAISAPLKLRPGDTTVACNPEWGLERLKQALRSFVKNFCCNVESPLIIYLDDLQWADCDTLSVVEDLLSDPEQSRLLFIGSYRDNEVSASSPLTSCISQIVSMRPQCVTDIHISNLDHDAVGEMVAGLLSISQEQAMSLANIIHQKTGGNCFYALLMIRHLHDRGLMYRSSEHDQWDWDVDRILGEVAVSDNDVDLLVQKLASLPQETMNALKVSAFLGTRINVAMLEELIPLLEGERGSNTVHDVLDVAVQANLIKMVHERSYFTFSHDRIEDTVYAIASKETGQLLHLRIGRILRCRISIDIKITQNVEQNVDSDHQLFLATDQLNRGSTLITDDQEKVDLAGLNLTVAKKLILHGAFQMSLTFLNIAVSLLGDKRWEQHYEMTLELNDTLAFVLLSNGKADACIAVVDEVRVHANCPEDCYEVHRIHLEMLASINQLDQCLKLGLELLKEVGCLNVPRKPSLIRHVIPKVISVMRLLKGMSDEDLLNLTPWPHDRQRQMFIFNTCAALIPVAYLLDEVDLIPILTCNNVQQTLRHGASSKTAAAFAGYGFLLSMLGDFDGAIRFATLTSGMMARFEEDPKCLTIINTMILPLRNPIQGSVSTSLRAYQTAFLKGDLRYAGQAADFHIVIRLAAGLPLASLTEDGFAFCRQLRKYDQQVWFKFLLVSLRAVVELRDRSSDMSEFVGETLDDEDFEDYLRRGGANAMHMVSFWMFAMYTRFYLGDMNSALFFAEKVWKSKAMDKGALVYMIEYRLISALIAIYFWRLSRKLRFRRIFRNHHKALASWAAKGNVNTLHLVALLDAVILVDGHRKIDFETGRKSFEKAISIATRCGFVHHAALANELVGRYCVESNTTDMYWARYYTVNARDLYIEWNATAKVTQMELIYHFLFEHDGSSAFLSGSGEGGHESNKERQGSTPLTGRSRAEIIVQTEKAHTTAAWNVCGENTT